MGLSTTTHTASSFELEIYEHSAGRNFGLKPTSLNILHCVNNF